MRERTITVIGATGAQGGGLVHAVLADPAGGWKVRAITRHPESDKAKALAAAGAEVVAADADDPPTLKAAFAGAAAAYCVTNFWEHMDPERELRQALALAAGVQAAGVGHVVWSTLEDTRKWVPLTDDRLPTLMGRYKVPHFDAKGEADAAFRQTGRSTTILLTSFYWDNLIHFGMGPRRQEDGTLLLALPMGRARLAGMAAEDIGKCAYGIVKAGTEYAGYTVGVAGELLTGEQMAAALGRALNQQVTYAAVPHDVYRGLGFPGADDLGNMFQIYVEFEAEFTRSRDVALARRLNPELQTFDAWLARNKDRIPIG